MRHNALFSRMRLKPLARIFSGVVFLATEVANLSDGSASSPILLDVPNLFHLSSYIYSSVEQIEIAMRILVEPRRIELRLQPCGDCTLPLCYDPAVGNIATHTARQPYRLLHSPTALLIPGFRHCALSEWAVANKFTLIDPAFSF